MRDELPGPQGDPAHHVSDHALRRALATLPPAPRETGRVALLLSRHADGQRHCPSHVRLTVDGGMPDDRWTRRLPINPQAQLAVMQLDIAQLIAGPQGLMLFGDNLIVDLDVSEANLPIGARLQVGDAVVEVTPKAHTGCKKFQQRFGMDAWAMTQDEALRSRRLRGVYWRVVTDGDVWLGAPITVLAR